MAYSAVVFPCPHWAELVEGLQGCGRGGSWMCVAGHLGLIICELGVGQAWVGWERPTCLCWSRLHCTGEQGL